MSETIVDMGNIEIGYEDDILVSLGLGSCVGVVLYDPLHKIGGLAHIMLSDSSEVKRALPEKKAMIADSDVIVRNTLKRILVNHEFEIVGETAEKNETLLIFRKSKPTVSLISAFLPPTSGMDMIQSLLYIDKEVNAIILSPPIKREVLLYYLNGGAQEVIQNPYTEQKVLSAVGYILHKNFLKFADKAIPIMLERMLSRGANKHNIIAKIVGGAHMFKGIMDESIMDIGKRNVEAVKKILNELDIGIDAKETGSDIGRTLKFDVGTGILKVKTKDGIKEI